ncbi:histone deacetylase complex, SIN3 component [Infundibulicybe gibba]|nr:histone deacetylase complex, SIN3 component [Infundibulicybe gibba]
MDNEKMVVDSPKPDEENTDAAVENPLVAPEQDPSPAEPSTRREDDKRPEDSAERMSALPDDVPNAPSRSESVGLLLQSTPMAVDEAPGNAESTPQGKRTPVPPAEPPGHAPLNRPLDVTDALSYLDAVKVQFNDQPDVYNRFLDIMKEFKSELIDTPGVIKRVSHLFNGHPSLIQGFNTFLPVGYRIECSTDAHDANFITVTTPSGVTMQTTNNGPGSGPILWSTSEGATIPGNDGLRPISPDPRVYNIDGQTMEPAVQYVQKIKQRCDPDTYRQFLDILARYHHKPDDIDEEEVSKQIARLFKDAPDLRSDFRVFMPERSQKLLDDHAVFPEGRSTRSGTPRGVDKGKQKLDIVASSAGGDASTKRKRKPTEREREVAAGKLAASNKVKKFKHPASQDLTPSSFNHKHPARPPSPRRSSYPNQAALSRPHLSNDETHFFDRVRRALDNRDTYNEFLKIVNLFTQDYIDTARLLKESRNFLGDSELFRQFKEILGWDDRKDREYHINEQFQQHGWTRPVLAGVQMKPGRVDLNVQYGSYRKLPQSEASVTCSGRDEMCRSVLNDEWVSHPTWLSEDSGFVAHKKNIYEEALHRSEEERHEYDFHIDAIVRTIAMLEPINNKIAQLSMDERGGFKLKPNLGGSAKSIHQRVIKKIYGRDAGSEVLQAMQESPALAIPVVLQRLKQKEEEWKRAQREWNKVWREVDARNYLKSLDHQGISFKTADKKVITTKAFVSQIEAAREEQMAKRASLIDPLFARTRPRHQLEFMIGDAAVLQDALKLTFSFLDRTQAQINFAERKRIEGFLRSFFPLFFMQDPVSFNAAFVVVQETLESDLSDDVGSVVDDAELSSTGSGGSRSGRNNRKAASTLSSGGDLRKKLLKSEQAKSTNRKTRAQEAASPSVSRLASPAPTEEEPKNETAGSGRRLSGKNVFFTNTIFYTLLRLVELLYSRLKTFKDIAHSTPNSPKNHPNSVAVGLGLPLLGDGATTSRANGSLAHYYDLLLESCERLFDNELEQPAFEDQMRLMFGTKEAYKIFTVDKLIGANHLADSRSQDLLEILKRTRALSHPTTQDLITSRRNAEKVLGPDENLFRIDWLPDSKTITVQLIGKDDSSFDDSEVLTGRWQAYIDSFVSAETTEGVAASKIKPPFLRRNLPTVVREVPPEVYTQDGLEIKVCVRTYRLFFVSHTEDFLWKELRREELAKASEKLKARNLLRTQWLAKSKEGG